MRTPLVPATHSGLVWAKKYSTSSGKPTCDRTPPCPVRPGGVAQRTEHCLRICGVCARMPPMVDSRHPVDGPGDPSRQGFDEAFAAAARFKEPSAAERAHKQGWLARRKAARKARRAGWAARPGRVRKVVTTSLALLLFIGVLGVAGWAAIVNLTKSGPTTRLAPATGRVAPAAAAATPSDRLPVDPFASSPAETYADGAAGIVPPGPHAVGPFSRAEVRRAYALTKRLLIAAHLNQHTMTGGKPSAFARLLAPPERRFFLKHLNDTGLSKQGDQRSTRAWVTSFAPGSAELATGVIKVHGTMSAHVARAPQGQPMLRITADYLFVYAVRHPGQPLSRMRIVFRDDVRVDFAQWDDPGGPLEPWWNPLGGGPAGASCDTSDGFIHPVFPGDLPGRVRPSGQPVDPYNLSVPPGSHGCRPVTRT